jgi:CIC family chloride channel protein
VGAGAGLGAIAFRELLEGITWLFSGRHDPSAAGRVGNPNLPGLGPWYLLVAPVLGGVLHGPLQARFAPEARGHGVAEVVLALAERDGHMRPRVPAVRVLASALTIGSGGSAGGVGPIVQIGSVLGSLVGQATGSDGRGLRLLVACGAAGGIAATFDAPIAGVCFALEVILRAFAIEALCVVALSAVTGAMIGRVAFGADPFLDVPAFTLTSPLELVVYAVLGLLGGVVGVAFIRMLYDAEDVADRLWRGPAWARPAIGGLVVGVLLLALPELYGIGFAALTRAIDGHPTVSLLGLLLVGKLVATSVTIGSGGSGGVFAPSLFLGAMLGAGFGQLAHDALPGLTAPGGAYALVGMGAVFAGSGRAPVTAVAVVVELTGEYALVLPLSVAVVIATAVSARLSADTVYTSALRRRGIRGDDAGVSACRDPGASPCRAARRSARRRAA